MQLLCSVYITAHLRETPEHTSMSPNRDFQGRPDLQDMSRNAWTDKAKKSPDASDHAHSAKQPNTMKYMTAFPSKPEIIQQESIFGLEPLSEPSKMRGMEPPMGYQKRTLRSITAPLTAYRLKPIRQKTKKAVVCPLFFKITVIFPWVKWFPVSNTIFLFFLFFFLVPCNVPVLLICAC